MDTAEEKKDDEKNSKRKKKTPFQVETLEKVFADEKYPSDVVRAELSVRLGLTDRQLQMWFCNRRLKDRKVEEILKDVKVEESSDNPNKSRNDKAVENPGSSFASETMDSAVMVRVGNCYVNQLTVVGDAATQRVKKARKRGSKDTDSSLRKDQLAAGKAIDPVRAAEFRAIVLVEAQLGEPLRQDGPILGLEFDPLPAGAFDISNAPLAHAKHAAVWEAPLSANKAYERHGIKSEKNTMQDHQQSHTGVGRQKAMISNVHPGARAFQEFQFIPEQPSARTEIDQAFERASQSNIFLALDYPLQALSSSASLLYGSESLANLVGYQGIMPDVGGGKLLQVDHQSSHLFSHSGLNFEGMYKDSSAGFGHANQFRGNQGSVETLLAGASQTGAEKQMGRKRKSEEARITKEVEAHEKRIRKELERQEIARRKKEDQMKKELEKQDREKRKEEERALREKAREEERIQREQRRELERQERLLQKETKKMEQQRWKEEIRQQKEAAKMKAALERATARRLARESMEPIDDERLELLEAAAAAQGLPSIYLLDGETLQGLDKYRGLLKLFPPASVEMKPPLAASPWVDSHRNVGNLLMVWRFLTTFADILGLWPFTVDELVQSLHDYDPRLLGEIHIALLRTLVKDIEDVAQASANGMVVNQYTVSFTGGGHPLLVEAAFAWGFNIRDWCKHLNGLTWPEVLRQFSLAAGYGPKWKKWKAEIDHPIAYNEENEGVATVNTLRSGVAAANAAALMQGKGGVQFRRCQHRLTPGTVKYAAFHVLSLEGAKGLTILEVADRIQKSGLRDLTTCKTPEASIAAALSRDTKLFDRVAPSTYCVRPSYRKDPEDAESILQAAREKIRVLQGGFADIEDVEKESEDADEAEREEDYMEDIEDISGDGIDEMLNEGKDALCVEGKVIEAGETKKAQPLQENIVRSTRLVNCNDMCPDNSAPIPDTSIVTKSGDCRREGSVNSEGCGDETSMLKENEIDESHVGEPWVQGLMEGEYSDLTVEERLTALLALVEMVNEGNTIRVALEERLEAANALKRQLWAETQLDKRRFKEEQLLKCQTQLGDGVKLRGCYPSMEEGQKSLHQESLLDGLSSIEGVKEKSELICEQSTPAAPGNAQSVVDKGSIMQAAPNQDMALITQAGTSTDKSRAQLKTDIGLRAEELYVYRSLPLGSDRRHNRYWQFITCNTGQDPGCGRVYFESSEDGHWEAIHTEKALDALMASLDTRGVREAHLYAALERCEYFLRQGMRNCGSSCEHQNEPSLSVRDLQFRHSMVGQLPRIDQISAHCNGFASEGSQGGAIVLPESDVLGQVGAISIEFGSTQIEKQHALERYIDLDRWLWRQFTNGPCSLNALKFGKKKIDVLVICDGCHELYWPRERHCSSCHATFESSPKMEATFLQHQLICEESRRQNGSNINLKDASKWLPSRMQLLKAEILAVEVAVPLDALNTKWTETRRKTWASMLKRASSTAELLQIVTELEAAVHRDWLSSSYETTDELLRAAASNSNVSSESPEPCGRAVLPWVPHTTAAVALRLKIFDAALSYSLEQKQRRSVEAEDNGYPRNVALRERALATGNAHDIELEEYQPSPEEEGNLNSDGQQSGRGRGKGGRPRGRGQGRSSTGKVVTAMESTPKVLKRKLQFSELVVPVDDRSQRERSGIGRGRGCRGRGRGRGAVVRGQRRRSRSARHGQFDAQKHRGTNFLRGQVKGRISNSVTAQEGIQSDEDASEGVQVETQEYDDKGENIGEGQQDIDDDVDMATSMDDDDEDEMDQEEEQILEDELEEDEGQYEEEVYHRGHAAEDSGEEEVQTSSPSSPMSSSSSSSLEGEVGAEEDDDEVSQSESPEESNLRKEDIIKQYPWRECRNMPGY